MTYNQTSQAIINRLISLITQDDDFISDNRSFEEDCSFCVRGTQLRIHLSDAYSQGTRLQFIKFHRPEALTPDFGIASLHGFYAGACSEFLLQKMQQNNSGQNKLFLIPMELQMSSGNEDLGDFMLVFSQSLTKFNGQYYQEYTLEGWDMQTNQQLFIDDDDE
jgi:hypothetical protein